jgi:hypothetical protein
VPHANLVDGQAKCIGGDLRHDRFEALPDGSGGDIHGDRTVGLEVEPRRFLRPGAGALDKARDRDAVVAAVDQPPLQTAFLVPAELDEAAIERLAVIPAVAFGVGRRAAGLKPRQLVWHLGGGDQIAASHLGTVDPQIACRQLDQPLAKNDAS